MLVGKKVYGVLGLGLLTALTLVGCSGGNGTPPTATPTAPVTSPSGTVVGPSVLPPTPTASPSGTATTTLNLKLTGGTTNLTLGTDFLTTLKKLNGAYDVTGKAELAASTHTITFPITGGTIATVAGSTSVQGSVTHDTSGMVLAKRSILVKLYDLEVHEGTQPYISGTVQVADGTVQQNVTIFNLDNAQLSTAGSTAERVSVSGAKVQLSAAAASLLNAALGTTLLHGGTAVGTLNINAH